MLSTRLRPANRFWQCRGAGPKRRPPRVARQRRRIAVLFERFYGQTWEGVCPFYRLELGAYEFVALDCRRHTLGFSVPDNLAETMQLHRLLHT